VKLALKRLLSVLSGIGLTWEWYRPPHGLWIDSISAIVLAAAWIAIVIYLTEPGGPNAA